MTNKTIKTFLAIAFILHGHTSQSQTYQSADLPDAMTFLNGREVKTKTDWEKRKAEIKDLWCEYFIGHYPQEIPELLSYEVISSEKREDSSIRKRIVLTFNTPNQRSFEIAVWEPGNMNDKPVPLFLTQPRNYQIQWAEEAVLRGYIACIYPGLDTHHNEKDFPE